MKKLALTAIAASLLAAPAFAQTSTTQNAPASPGAAAVMTESQISNLWRASKLDDVDIYNNNNEKIGEIDDVLIDRTGKAVAVVVDVGGFLGIGTHRVALKFDDVKFSDAPRNADMAKSDRSSTTTTTTTGAANAPAGAPPSTVSTTDNARATNANANNNRMYPDHATLNMTKEQLKALPQVSYRR